MDKHLFLFLVFKARNFPYGFATTLPNIQGIPNQSLGYQVIRPMLYDYSFMYSQGTIHPRPQGPDHQL